MFIESTSELQMDFNAMIKYPNKQFNYFFVYKNQFVTNDVFQCNFGNKIFSAPKSNHMNKKSLKERQI